MKELKNHNIVETNFKDILFEKRPCLNNDGKPVEGLYNAWIILNNPKQFNSYTTQAVKEIKYTPVNRSGTIHHVIQFDWFPLLLPILD